MATTEIPLGQPGERRNKPAQGILRTALCREGEYSGRLEQFVVFPTPAVDDLG